MAKYATVSIHLGFRGDNVWLEGGSEWPDDHPVVREYPDYFTDTPPGGKPEPRRPRAAVKATRPPARQEQADA